MARKKSSRADRCKKTGKIKYVTANAAVAVLGKSKQKDTKCIRIYRCKYCKHFHLGKNRG